MTLPKFEALAVRTFGDARRLPVEELVRVFGDSGAHFHELVRGIDERPVVPDREARSISHEVTFAQDITDVEHLRSVLLQQIEQVAQRLRHSGRAARTVCLKIRTPDFRTKLRRHTLPEATTETTVLWRVTAALFEEWARASGGPVRLIGAGVTQLEAAGGGQLPLFDGAAAARRRRLDQTIDDIRGRFGDRAIRRGRPEAHG